MGCVHAWYDSGQHCILFSVDDSSVYGKWPRWGQCCVQGYGTVRFTTKEDAEKAIADFHGTELESRALAVKIDKCVASSLLLRTRSAVLISQIFSEQCDSLNCT